MCQETLSRLVHHHVCEQNPMYNNTAAVGASCGLPAMIILK
jgi:hypothetical protein